MFFIPVFRAGGRFVILLFILLGSKPLAAQIRQEERFELVHESGDKMFTTISLKENGISLIREKDRLEDNKRVWEVTLLDTAMNKTWGTDIPLSPQLKLVGYEYTSGEVFYLFRAGESDFGDFHLIRVHILTHRQEEYDITPKLEIKLTHFIVAGNSCVLGGYVSHNATILLYEMGRKKLHVLPGFFEDKTELLELKSNTNQTFNTLLMDRGDREKKLLILNTFDESGAVLLDDKIEVDMDKVILAGTTSTLEHDELLLAGTWGTGANRQAAGIFTVMADPFSKQAIHYMTFDELNHFFDYLSPKRVSKIKSNASKKRQEGKLPGIRASVHVVRIEESKKGFGLLCEVYQPSFNSNFPSPANPNYNPYYSPYYNPYNSYGYSPYGYNPIMMNRSYNSPYYPYGLPERNSEVSMLYSSLVIFDSQGKVKEDFGFKFDDMKLPTLEQISDFRIAENFVQFYKKERTVYVLSNWSDGNAPEQDTVQLNLKLAHDIVKNEAEEQGGVRHWFGPYLYAWGFETIKNKTESTADPIRYVYYINKLRVE
jgi:hypothetical protein